MHRSCLPLVDLRGGVTFCSGDACVLLPQLQFSHSAPTFSWVVSLESGGWGEVGESSIAYKVFGNVVKSFSGWPYLLLAGIDDIFVIY